MSHKFSPIDNKYAISDDLPKMPDEQQAFLARWIDRSADLEGRLPARADFPPNKFAKMMSRVIVFDVTSEPLDFHFRLMGTGVTDYTHKDFTGKNLSDLVDKGPGSKRWAQLETVVETKKPLYDSLPYVGPRVSIILATVLLVPMASDYTNVDKIFQVTNFIERHQINL